MVLSKIKTTLLATTTAFVLLPGVTADDQNRPTNFPLDGRPEGITEGPGSTLFVGEILTGRVLSIDTLSGLTNEIVPAQTGDRQAWGLWYYEPKYIFVAGGGPSFGGGTVEVHVYDVEMGQAIVSCEPLSTNEFGAFLNDVAISDNTAYITDSVHGKLMAMNADDAVAGNCTVWEVDLPSNFAPVEVDDFGANGVVPYGDGLLVAHEIDGSVWYIDNLEPDSVTGNVTPTFQEVIPDGGAPAADGLTVLGNTLYVTQNFEDKIGVFSLKPEDLSGTILLGNLFSDQFFTPATSAIYDGYIYSTNSRFATLEDIAADADDNVVAVALDSITLATTPPTATPNMTETTSPTASPTTSPTGSSPTSPTASPTLPDTPSSATVLGSALVLQCLLWIGWFLGPSL